MTSDANPTRARAELLRRRFREAQALMGCGDSPDVGLAASECERIEGELAHLERTIARSEGCARC